MTWWWESIHANNLYSNWTALSAFLQGSGAARADLRPARFDKIEGPVTPYGMAARDLALVWFLDRGCDWPEGATNANPPAVNGARVTLTGLEDGAWTVEWWDTLAGKCVASQTRTATAGSLQLEPPGLQADIAAKLRKK